MQCEVTVDSINAICFKVSTRCSWYELANHFGVSSHDLAAGSKQKLYAENSSSDTDNFSRCRQVLMLWRDRNAMKATCSRLIELLGKAGFVRDSGDKTYLQSTILGSIVQDG